MPQQAIVNPTFNQIQAYVQGFNLGLQNLASSGYQFANYFDTIGPNFPGIAYLQNGLASISIDNTNSNGLYSGTPSVAAVAPPNPAIFGQQIATFTLAYGIGVLTQGAGGTSYAVNDVLTLATSGATVKVLTAPGGVIGTWQTLTIGTGAAIASGVAVTGGTGTGATFNVTGLTPAAATLVNVGAGYGYVSPPLVTLTDSTGGGAVLTAVLANTNNALNMTPSQSALIQAVAADMNLLSLVIQGEACVAYGDSKSISGATNAAPIVLTVNSVVGLVIGQAVTVSGVTPGAYNISAIITGLASTGGSAPFTITLSNGSPPGSAYVSGGIVEVQNNMPFVATGYNFETNVDMAAGVGF